MRHFVGAENNWSSVSNFSIPNWDTYKYTQLDIEMTELDMWIHTHTSKTLYKPNMKKKSTKK